MTEAKAMAKPRLKEHYETHVRKQLRDTFGFENPMEVPRLEKIVVNAGLGEAKENPDLLEAARREIMAITGQQPLVTRARQSISNFNLRQGDPVGVKVTLRDARMYEFLDRFVSTAVPRIRDFRGFNSRAFDGRGNYTVGIDEQLIFPEVDVDDVVKVYGMNVTLITTTDKDDEALVLLRELGVPFRGEQPTVV